MEEGEIPSDGEDTHTAHKLPPLTDVMPVRGSKFADMSGVVYSSEYEWPGEDTSYAHSSLAYSASDFTSSDTDSRPLTPANEHAQSSSRAPALPSLRFLVQESTILHGKHKLAVIDGYTEANIYLTWCY